MLHNFLWTEVLPVSFRNVLFILSGCEVIILSMQFSDNHTIFTHSVNGDCVFIDAKEFSDNFLIAMCACVGVCVFCVF